MDEGWVAVVAGAAVSEAEMRAVVVAGTGADVEETAPAAISPLAARPNHALRGGQMDCQRANRPLWPIVQKCVGINGAVQCMRERESLCVFSSPAARPFMSSSLSAEGPLFLSVRGSN